jgi:hypothetical protein
MCANILITGASGYVYVEHHTTDLQNIDFSLV